MKIAVFGNQCQDHRADDIRLLFAAMRSSGAYIEVERGFLDYVHGLIPDVAVDKAVGAGETSADVVVSIGGDGTFLRAAAWVGSREIPILGVNTGHLGYLSDVAVADAPQFIAGLADGNFRIERRSLIEVETNAGVALANRFALNEVAILKNASSSMLAMDTAVDGSMLNTYLGDGLIMATPTGSTAYNLSVGGPILHPACNCFVLSPIAAHSLTMRPLVLPDGVEVDVTTRSERSHTFRISIDGESLSLPIGSTIRMRKADFSVNVMLRADHDFSGALRNKLMWGADVR